MIIFSMNHLPVHGNSYHIIRLISVETDKRLVGCIGCTDSQRFVNEHSTLDRICAFRQNNDATRFCRMNDFGQVRSRRHIVFLMNIRCWVCTWFLNQEAPLSLRIAASSGNWGAFTFSVVNPGASSSLPIALCYL